MADTDAPIAAAPTPAAKPARPKSEPRDTLMFLLKLALVVAIFRSFFFSPFYIPSQSMLPRLYVGDYLFISKWNYGYSRWSLPFGVPLIPGRIMGGTPARGDIVVFRGPPGDDHDVIKRVIGLPGDTVQMQNGQVILNGQAIPKQPVADFVIPLSPNYPAGVDANGQEGCPAEFQDSANNLPVCRYKQFRETLPAAGGRAAVSYTVLDRGPFPSADDTGVYAVPPGTVFVMGDNRDDSGDSRFPPPQGMGFVPLERIEGKALVSFWSTDGNAQWLLPWTWFTAARWERMGEAFLNDPLAGWIAAATGHIPGDLAPFARALTHGSQGAANYERLEFLGDRVLGLVIAEWLIELFPDEAEGALSKRLHALVSGAACAEVARTLGVGPHLRLGKQARDDGAADSDNVLGDVMESLIAALYRDAGLAVARAFIRRRWGDRVTRQASAPQHPKSALLEWAAAHRRKPPSYAVLGRAGPDHAPTFTVRASLGRFAEAEATGSSKQEAETAAAAALLAMVGG